MRDRDADIWRIVGGFVGGVVFMLIIAALAGKL